MCRCSRTLLSWEAVAAATIAKAGRSVVVHERRGVVGGDARSVTNDEGFTFNQGPHALYRAGPAETILTALGVRIDGGRPPTKGKLAFGGRVEIAPGGPVTLLRTKALDRRAKLEIGKQLGRLPKLNASDYASITVRDWIASLVDTERASQLLHAMVRLATYANRPDELSADVAIMQLQSALGTGVLYLHGGWQVLVDQLAATPGVHIVVGDPLAELPDAPTVIVATGGASVAGSLLNRTWAVGPPAHASCLDLGLSRKPDSNLVIGGDVPFYFSNHSSVATLAPRGQHHATSIQYLGEGDEPDADQIMDFARLAGVRDEDVIATRKLHRMTAATAVPTALQGGLRGRPSVSDTGMDNVFIAGDWVGPDGHLADASVASGHAAAEAALARLESRVWA